MCGDAINHSELLLQDASPCRIAATVIRPQVLTFPRRWEGPVLKGRARAPFLSHTGAGSVATASTPLHVGPPVRLGRCVCVEYGISGHQLMMDILDMTA